MLNLYRSLLFVHIAFGTVGLVAFWFPIASKKGQRLHRKAGRIFLRCAYVVPGTAIAIATVTIADPFGTHPEDRPSSSTEVAATATAMRISSVFLAYLALVTLASVHHGVRAMETKSNPAAIKTRFHTGLNALAVASSLLVLVLGLTFGSPALLALSPLGIYVGARALRYGRRPRKQRMSHWYEHMGSMIGGGIAFYTAFIVTGVQRFCLFRVGDCWGYCPGYFPE